MRIVIVGGGVVGCAIAYFLTLPDRDCEVTVIERDPMYRQASSALSASSIRQQFSSAVNIRLSRFGIEFYRTIADRLSVDDDRPEIGLVEPGYLYLAATAAGAGTLRTNHRMQQAEGADVALLDPVQLKARFPWLATDDLMLGALGLSGEGWYDGPAVLRAFRRKAQAQGVRFVGAEAVGFARRDDGAVSAVTLADGDPVACDVAVNAAGPWAAAVSGWAGIDLPVRARRRTVHVFRCAQALDGVPLVIDPSGLWFRPESARDGSRFLCGDTPPAAHDLDDLPLEPELTAFDERLWPALAARVPAFEAVRATGAWAGYYEMNTFDHNAIVGIDPRCPNLHHACGFSGHGLQQAPAIGRGVAERIREGGWRTLDLTAIDIGRIADGRPLVEHNVI